MVVPYLLGIGRKGGADCIAAETCRSIASAIDIPTFAERRVGQPCEVILEEEVTRRMLVQIDRCCDNFVAPLRRRVAQRLFMCERTDGNGVFVVGLQSADVEGWCIDYARSNLRTVVVAYHAILVAEGMLDSRKLHGEGCLGTTDVFCRDGRRSELLRPIFLDGRAFGNFAYLHLVDEETVGFAESRKCCGRIGCLEANLRVVRRVVDIDRIRILRPSIIYAYRHLYLGLLCRVDCSATDDLDADVVQIFGGTVCRSHHCRLEREFDMYCATLADACSTQPAVRLLPILR